MDRSQWSPGLFGFGGLETLNPDAISNSLSDGPRLQRNLLLAALLDRSPQGPLTRALHQDPKQDLHQAFGQLSTATQSEIKQQWGAQLGSFFSLAQDPNPSSFFNGLLQIGSGVEGNGKIEAAHLIFSALQDPATAHVPAAVREKAKSRSDAMAGVGDSKARWAFHLRHLKNEVTRLDMFSAMAVAGPAFRFARYASTLKFSPFFKTAQALKAATWSSAFLAETGAFTAMAKVTGALTGVTQDWSAGAWSREWAGATAMLLGLKSMGGAFGLAGIQCGGTSGPLHPLSSGHVHRHRLRPRPGALQRPAYLTGRCYPLCGLRGHAHSL
jgi:hypothetical protein